MFARSLGAEVSVQTLSISVPLNNFRCVASFGKGQGMTGSRSGSWLCSGYMKLAAVALLVLLSGCGTTQPNKGIVFIGDSITEEWDRDYNGQLATFTQNGWIDLGVLGNTSSQILAHFQSSVPQLHPQIVQIIAGTNDTNTGWVLANTSTNIEAMVQLAKENHIAVILGTIPPWGPGPIAISEDPTYRFARIAQLNQWIVDYAAQQGITVADYHSVLAAPNGENYGDGLSFDGIHPSPTGYSLMTTMAEQVLQTAMANPSP
jgi:lysophospholipase L1-like esterase